MNTKDVISELPNEAYKQRKFWLVCFFFWGSLHYILGIPGTICSVIVATMSINFSGDNSLLVGLSITAAVFSGLTNFLTPKSKATGYLTAWRVMNEEIVASKTQANYSSENFRDILSKCENILAQHDGF